MDEIDEIEKNVGQGLVLSRGWWLDGAKS